MTFVTSPGAGLPDLSAETVDEVNAMRQLYPELAHWSDFAFFIAWGAYSKDVHAISWVYWLTTQRDTGFLAYCYVVQRWPEFEFGGTGLFEDEIGTLGEQQPWTVSPPPVAPAWVQASYRPVLSGIQP